MDRFLLEILTKVKFKVLGNFSQIFGITKEISFKERWEAGAN